MKRKYTNLIRLIVGVSQGKIEEVKVILDTKYSVYTERVTYMRIVSSENQTTIFDLEKPNDDIVSFVRRNWCFGEMVFKDLESSARESGKLKGKQNLMQLIKLITKEVKNK